MLQFLKGNGDGKHASWLARCDCGKTVTVVGKEAARGSIKTCGQCQYHQEVMTQRGSTRKAIRQIDGQYRKLYARYVTDALRRGIKWELTPEDCIELFKKECTYCGDKVRGKYSGIDRINSGASYTLDNTVSCCSTCNYMKRSLSLREFLEKIAKIHTRMAPIYEQLTQTAGPGFHKNQSGKPPF